jgi:hypothetical protein
MAVVVLGVSPVEPTATTVSPDWATAVTVSVAPGKDARWTQSMPLSDW